jgi:thioredoxin-like negative regulator of GroEL
MTAVPFLSDQNADFFGLQTLLLILIPTAAALYFGARRSLRRYDPRLEFDEENFDRLVLESPVPVVVHFHQSWDIKNRVMESSLKALAEKQRTRVPVGFVDIDRSPEVVGRYPELPLPCVTIFHEGELLWVLEGVFYEEDVEDVLEQIESQLDVDFEELYARADMDWERARRGYR